MKLLWFKTLDYDPNLGGGGDAGPAHVKEKMGIKVIGKHLKTSTWSMRAKDQNPRKLKSQKYKILLK